MGKHCVRVARLTLALGAGAVGFGCSSDAFRGTSDAAGQAGVVGVEQGGAAGKGGAQGGRHDGPRGGATEPGSDHAQAGVLARGGGESEAGAQARAGGDSKGGAQAQAGTQQGAGVREGLEGGAQSEGGSAANGGSAAQGGAAPSGGSQSRSGAAGQGGARAPEGLGGASGTPCSEDCEAVDELRLGTGALPDAWIGQPYWVELEITGGTAPYSFELSSVVPELDWLELDEVGGTLAGVPDVALPSPGLLEVTVTDSASTETRATYGLTVRTCVGQDELDCFVSFEGACARGTVFCRDGQPGGCSLNDPLVPSTELDHCGPSCGGCDPTRANACAEGLCRCGDGPICEAGLLCCGSGEEAECVDPGNDLRHCGACGEPCTAGEHATTDCEEGQCSVPECVEGWGDCDPGRPGDCSFNLIEDPLHCGACDNVCPQPAGEDETAECVGGRCTVVCVEEASRCDAGARLICANGTWQSLGRCSSHCLGGECVDCEPGARDCGSGGLEVCNAEGYWESRSCSAGEECVGEGACLKSDGQVCSSSSACASGKCMPFHRDADGDGYGHSATTSLCGASAPSGYVSNSDDCCDTDPRAKPDQTDAFSSARDGCGGHDFDCDGSEVPANAAVISGCNTSDSCHRNLGRWYEVVPGCGDSGDWAYGCACSADVCCPVTQRKTQACR